MKEPQFSSPYILNEQDNRSGCSRDRKLSDVPINGANLRATSVGAAQAVAHAGNAKECLLERTRVERRFGEDFCEERPGGVLVRIEQDRVFLAQHL